MRLTVVAGLMLAASLGVRAAPAGSIMMIGDSHSTLTFGQRLHGHLRKLSSKPRVALYAVSGASANSFLRETPHLLAKDDRFWDYDQKTPKKWINADRIKATGKTRKGLMTPSIQALLADHSPELVIIALGSNDFGNGRSKGAEAGAAKLAKLVRASTRCIWIGPPDFPLGDPQKAASVRKSLSAFNKALKAAVSGKPTLCEGYVDSLSFTKYEGNKAGEHYNSKGYAKWADGAIEKLKDMLN
jgi:lysophospholipase L1-like esterase